MPGPTPTKATAITVELPPQADDANHFTSAYPMHGEVFLRASVREGRPKVYGRIAAITFVGTQNHEEYLLRLPYGDTLTVSRHEIDSDTT